MNNPTPFQAASRRTLARGGWLAGLVAGARAWGWPGGMGLLALGAAWALAGRLTPDVETLVTESRAKHAPFFLTTETADASSVRFRQTFPPARERSQRTAALLSLAQAQGLRLERAEFTLGAPGPGGLLPYRMTLPVRGRYSALREFLNLILQQDPAISLDGLRLTQPEAGSADDLRVVLRFTLHMQADDPQEAR